MSRAIFTTSFPYVLMLIKHLLLSKHENFKIKMALIFEKEKFKILNLPTSSYNESS